MYFYNMICCVVCFCVFLVFVVVGVDVVLSIKFNEANECACKEKLGRREEKNDTKSLIEIHIVASAYL